MSTFSIPAKDLPEFATLKEACRMEVRQRLRAVAAVLKADRGKIGATVAAQAASLGIDQVTMRKFSDRYKNSGDWRVLIDRRRFPDADEAGLPVPLQELIKTLCEKNQRGKVEAAHRMLIRMWRAGEPQGVTWPDMDPHTKLPRGLTYRNVCRYASTAFEQTAMNDGLGAAMAAHGPQVLTTRVGLWVGSRLLIDDVLRDMKLMMLGGRGQIVRPQEFGVLDLFSGDRFAVHRRPYFKRADGTIDGVKEFEMRFLLANVFRNTGFSPRGTEIVMEWGTATVRRYLAKWLHEVSGGKITTRGPGITGREQALAGWYGSGKGNPRHKAALESHHNLLHNEAAWLPAATGHDRNPPEWLHGVERHAEDVLTALRTLPPAIGAGLETGMLEYWQGLSVLQQIDQWIAWRRDHDLEGWVESGHVRVEYCRDLVEDAWVTAEEFATLKPEAQRRLAAAAEAHPSLRRVVKLAPREVFAAGARELVAIPDHAWALFFCDRDLGDDLRSKPKTLTADGVIELQDRLAAPGPMFFRRELACPGGGSRRLQDKDKFSVVLNPFDLQQLWVYGQGGDFLGTAPSKDRVSPLDTRAIEIELGHRSHEKSLMVAPLRERHADAERMIGEMQEHLADARAGVLTVDQRAAARAEERSHDSALNLGRALRDEHFGTPSEPLPLPPSHPTTPIHEETC